MASRRLSICFAAGLAVAAASSSARAAAFDFESAGQYTDAFRPLARASEMTQTANGMANDYLHKVGSSGNTSSTSVYDLTPADATEKTTFSGAAGITVSFDARFSTATHSLGIAFVDPTNEDSALLALFNVDNSGTQDIVRFFSGSNLTSTNAGSQAGSTVTGTSNIDASPTAAFAPMTVTYTIDGTTPVLTLTAGGLSTTSSFPAGTAIANPEIGLRLFAGNSSSSFVDLDNLTIVPEPGSVGLIALVGAGLLARRRRAT